MQSHLKKEISKQTFNVEPYQFLSNPYWCLIWHWYWLDIDSLTSWIADDIEVLGKHDLSANGYWRPSPKGFLLNLLHIIPTALMSLCLPEYLYVKLGFVEEPGRRIGIPWLFSMRLLTTALGHLILQFNRNLLIHLQHIIPPPTQSFCSCSQNRYVCPTAQP